MQKLNCFGSDDYQWSNQIFVIVNIIIDRETLIRVEKKW